ncbi:angiopoietin-4 isoform X2 [Drosophila ananassae]|uniref:angiopoietin-4 isoform X2 n=1 Tax=Drosophila ananassae TaxID=7217 RepID=UPI001CFF76E8|nr:angiopoietin-4 isoform X2 [Drosophila ananassae]
MILKAVVLLLIPVSLAVEQESSYPLWQPLLGLLETCQSKNYQLQEKLSEVQSQLFEVNLKKKDLQAEIAQQAAQITRLQDQTSELGKLKDLFREEIAKLREVVKSGSGTEPNEAEKNATIAESGELAKNEATNTTHFNSTQVDRCPSTQDTWRVYREIQFPGLEPFQVTCYSYKRVGSGWMEVFFKNYYSTEFNQTYDQYINGFGDVEEEHFIGLEKLHILTSQKPHEVYITYYTPPAGIHSRRFYEVLCRNFVVGDRSEGYSLKRLDGCSGDTSHFNLIQGTKFSTFDRNQDGNPDHNWSRDYGNGFWFNAGKPIFEKGAFIHFLIRR